MNKKFFLPLAVLISFNVHAQDPAAMPMMADPIDGKKSQEETLLNYSQVKRAFQAAYSNVGEPSIAIFWNRKFDDQLSQWQADRRHSITGEGSSTASDIFQKQGDIQQEDALNATVSAIGNAQPSGEILGSYERNTQGGSRILAAEYYESRKEQAKRRGLGEAADFEFGSGFMGPFLEQKANILDRDTIMRLVERDNTEEAGSEMIADYQKIETDALIGFADYFAEVLMTRDYEADLGMSFMVSIKEVATGRIVTMFKSAATPPEEDSKKAKFIATSSGYKKVASFETTSPEDVGTQLAHETMVALSKIWGSM